jgi:hypothetical protein
MIAWLMPHDQIANFAHVIEPVLKKGFARIPEWTPTQALQDAHDGEIEMWLTFDDEDNSVYSVTGTMVAVEEDGKRLHVLFTCGTGWKRWGYLFQELKDHAKRNDCEAIRFRGRKAWQRVLSEMTIIGTKDGLPVYELRV